SAGYMLNDVFEPHMNSSTITASVNGPACPPRRSSTASVRQPASNSAFQPSLKPAGTCTWPFSSRTPSSSPLRLYGPRYFCTHSYASSSTAWTSSLPQFAYGTLPISSSSLNCSNSRNDRSRRLDLYWLGWGISLSDE